MQTLVYGLSLILSNHRHPTHALTFLLLRPLYKQRTAGQELPIHLAD